MGICYKHIATGSPWQIGLAERLIGSSRRECTEPIIAIGEEHLRWARKSYARYYYYKLRTHRSLTKYAPSPSSNRGPRCHHFTVGSLWTAPPISPHLIFGARRHLLVADEIAPSAVLTALRSTCTGASKSPRTIVRRSSHSPGFFNGRRAARQHASNGRCRKCFMSQRRRTDSAAQALILIDRLFLSSFRPRDGRSS